MRMERLVVALAVLTGMAMASVALGADGKFFLVDQRTQIPVMCCNVAPGWLAGGKTTWTATRENPVTWYAWTMSPDRRFKAIVSSPMVLAAPNWRIQQVPYLQNPQILANAFVQGVQRDYGVQGVRVAEARLIPRETDKKLLEARLKQARERNIQPTNFLFAELFFRFIGSRDGKQYSVIFRLPMLAMENRPGLNFSTVVEVMMPMSYGCPAGSESEGEAGLAVMFRSFQLNPQFVQMVNQITDRRVSEWIRVQNEIRKKQLEVASSTSETQERVRDMWSEYIRGVDKVSNPATGEKMFVDNRYDHAWINGDGEVLYHNSGFNTPDSSSASFNPNSDSLFNQTSWSQLK